MKRIISILNNNKKSIFISLVVYSSFFLLLIVFEISSPKIEVYEGFLVDFEDEEKIELPKIEETQNEELIDDNRLNVAVNEALKSNPTSNPYDFYNMEEQSDKYKNELIKNSLSEQEYSDYINKNYEYNEKEIVEEKKIEQKKVEPPNKNANYQGATYIKYNLKDRHDTKLIVPTYKCEGYGKVVVKIVVNKLGKVINAEIISADNNSCLKETALNSALNTLFDKNINAPEKQTGTISYTFMQQ